MQLFVNIALVQAADSRKLKREKEVWEKRVLIWGFKAKARVNG